MPVDVGSAYGKIVIDTQGITTGVRQARGEVRNFESALKGLAVPLSVAGAALTGLAVKTTLTAARTEELGVVMRNMAKNSGVSLDALEDQEQAIKSLGITTQVADKLLIQFMRYQLDSAQATDLARLAQDAAVIAMQDSSQALEGLLHGIVTYNPRVLRTYGITVDLQRAFQDYAESVGKSVLEVTAAEKQQIALNQVLAQGGAIAGTYEAAMGTAGKQLRSMSRHVEEASNEFGEHLLPAMGAVVQAGTDLLKWLQALPDPIQATVAQVGALTGGLAAAAGSAAFLIPKIQGVGAAVSGLASMVGLSTAALLAPAGLIAAVTAAAIYLHNLEKSHQEEAAAILANAETYHDYIQRLEDAGLEAYAFSEALYELAKAKQETDKAFDTAAFQAALKELEALGRLAPSQFQRGLPIFVRGLSDLALIIAQDREQMEALAEQLGYTGDLADLLIDRVTTLANVEETLRQKTDGVHTSMRELAGRVHEARTEVEKSTRALHDQRKATAISERAHRQEADAILDSSDSYEDYIEQLKEAGLESYKLTKSQYALAKAAEEAADALVEAVDRVTDRYEDFYGTLARGLVNFRDLKVEQAESAKDYEKKLADLEAKAKGVYSQVKLDFEESLPDKTTVADRMKMTEDAWDEWGLRFQDIIENGMASPYAAMLDQMGLAKPPDVGIKEWGEQLKEGFYAGDLMGLINENSQAWQDHAATMKEAQQEATAAYNAEVAKRKAALAEETAALKAAREEQLAAEREARNRATVELALSLAEQTGLLQQWSEQEFGPDFSKVADSADEVLGLIDAGMLAIDGDLQALIQNTVAGVQNALDTTGGLAEQNKQLLQDIAETDWWTPTKRQLETALDLSTILDPESAAQAGQLVSDYLTRAISEDPFLPLSTSFEGATAAMIAAAGTMDLELSMAFGNVDTKQSEVAAAILERWVGGSVFPDLIAGGQGMQREVSASLMIIKAHNALVVSDIVHRWKSGMHEVRDAVRGVVSAIRSLPRLIVITVRTEIIGTPPPELQAGGPVTAGVPYLVGEAGPELFVPSQAGMVLPNPMTQALLALVRTLQETQGPRAGGFGDAGQHVYMYGGQQIYGAESGQSLLAQLQELGG